MKLYFIYSLFFLAEILICESVPTPTTKKPAKFKPTMVGEPLTPADYENGIKLVIDAELAKDMNDKKITHIWFPFVVIDAALAKNMTFNDGTMNDIITPKKETLLRAAHSKLWPNGTIPYLLDSNFTESDRANVARAIQLIESKTCIRIISRTTEENYVLLRKNKGRGCASTIGMHGGKQGIHLAERCLVRFGSTAHEFMHAIGFYHEHERPDRDDYIIVHYENIADRYKGQFKKVQGEHANNAAGYDMKSITHYSNGADSKNGKHTMDPKNGTGQLGQREGLTELDVEKINNYYSCANKTSRSFDISEDDSEAPDDTDTLAEPSQSSRTFTALLCIDLDPVSCQMWAKHGYCEKSLIFMSVYCKATCKKCDSGCVDMNKKCKEWAKRKYCKKYWHYMYMYCPASCNKCPATPEIPLLPSATTTPTPSAVKPKPATTAAAPECAFPFCILN